MVNFLQHSSIVDAEKNAREVMQVKNFRSLRCMAQSTHHGNEMSNVVLGVGARRGRDNNGSNLNKEIAVHNFFIVGGLGGCGIPR